MTEYEKELTTTLWLKYDRLDRDHVSALKCKVCIQFEDQLTSTRNFNRTFISGSTNFRVSTVKDHVSSAMHQRAMLLYRKSQSISITDYSPIARALSTLDAGTEMKVTRKFEIAYAICKEGLAFSKMAPLCELEERHGVDLGSGYKTINACSEFVGYIAMAQRKQLVAALAKANFFSIQADGTTDAANIDDELFLVLFF